MEKLIDRIKVYRELKLGLENKGSCVNEALVLGVIIKAEKKDREVTASYLCKECKFQPSYFTRVSTRLIQKSYIKDSISSKDKRKRIFKTTPLGEDVYKKLEESI